VIDFAKSKELGGFGTKSEWAVVVAVMYSKLGVVVRDTE